MAIFLPTKIKVGYNKRNDTYTGKLGYVIYYGKRGELCKERSWRGWIEPDQGEDDYTNEPVEGFVLNKKVGDYRSDWNHRQAKARVYDPRGFEFEISIENLLYILENTNSIKGKGLEGKFVYGWDSGDLILIPECAPEYQDHLEYSKMVTEKGTLKSKDLILGAVYKDNNNRDLIYLGRFDYWKGKYRYSYSNQERDNAGPHYFFAYQVNKLRTGSSLILKSISGRILRCTDSNPVSNYAELMDDLQRCEEFSPRDRSKDVYVPLKLEELEKYYHYSNSVYFELDGLMYRANISFSQPSGLNEMSYGFSSIYRDIPGHQHGREPEARYAEAKIELSGHGHPHRHKRIVTLEELNDTYKLQTKKRYLANGKEQR